MGAAWDGYGPADAALMRTGDEAGAQKWLEDSYGRLPGSTAR